MNVISELEKILIIEDNRDSRDILSKLLRMSGYDVVSASDGETGYTAAADHLPDLIITDIHMPKVDGIEFVKRVREDVVLGRIPILVVTAFGGNMAREAVMAGADASVEKPFDFDKFLTTVVELISQNRKVAQS
ncbi:MAG TPA: response regulator [Blastocatellia bacterium]|nr:response regulator [Blastocatellia bacterium]